MGLVNQPQSNSMMRQAPNCELLKPNNEEACISKVFVSMSCNEHLRAKAPLVFAEQKMNYLK